MTDRAEETKKPRHGFFDHYGISEEEEAFFRMIYRRRLIYRWIIAALTAALALSLLLR